MDHYSFIIIILIVIIYLFNFTNLSNFNPFIIKKEKFEDCPYGCGCRRCMRRMGNCPFKDDTI
jgi:hypothetical protein